MVTGLPVLWCALAVLKIHSDEEEQSINAGLVPPAENGPATCTSHDMLKQQATRKSKGTKERIHVGIPIEFCNK